MNELKVKPIKRRGGQAKNTNALAKDKSQKKTALEARCKQLGWDIKKLEKADDPRLEHPIGRWIVGADLHQREEQEVWDAFERVQKTMGKFYQAIDMRPYAKSANLEVMPEHLHELAEDQQTRTSLTPEQLEARNFHSERAYMDMDTKARAGMGRNDWEAFKDMCMGRIEPFNVKRLAYSFIAAME